MQKAIWSFVTSIILPLRSKLLDVFDCFTNFLSLIFSGNYGLSHIY